MEFKDKDYWDGKHELCRRRMVFGVNTWPEPDQEDFAITEVAHGESDKEAIARAKSYYSPDLECYIKEVDC